MCNFYIYGTLVPLLFSLRFGEADGCLADSSQWLSFSDRLARRWDSARGVLRCTGCFKTAHRGCNFPCTGSTLRFRMPTALDQSSQVIRCFTDHNHLVQVRPGNPNIKALGPTTAKELFRMKAGWATGNVPAYRSPRCTARIISKRPTPSCHNLCWCTHYYWRSQGIRTKEDQRRKGARAQRKTTNPYDESREYFPHNATKSVDVHWPSASSRDTFSKCLASTKSIAATH